MSAKQEPNALKMLAPYFATDGKTAYDYLMALLRYHICIGAMGAAAKVAMDVAKLDIAIASLKLKDPKGDGDEEEEAADEQVREHAEKLLERMSANLN